MATVHYRDRVKDVCTCTGTGPITLNNTPPAGYKSFVSAFNFPADSIAWPNLVAYCIIDEVNNTWEMGIGEYDGVNTITRATIGNAIKSTSNNSFSAIDFAAGTKTIFCTPYQYGLGFKNSDGYLDGIGVSGGGGALPQYTLLSGDGLGNLVVTPVTHSSDFATLIVPSILTSSTSAFTIKPLTLTQPYSVGTLTITTSAASGGTSATTRAGGPLVITTGVGYLTGAGGKITIKPGSTGVAGSTTATGAPVTITGGDTTTTGAGAGGLLSLTGGSTSGTGAGGTLRLAGGAGTTGGPITITSGNGGAGNGGNISLVSGTSFAGTSGTIDIASGIGTAGNGSLSMQQGAIQANWINNDPDPPTYQLGFFGTTPVSKQSATTLAELITALQNYGLIS